jgi:hypothetical protein
MNRDNIRRQTGGIPIPESSPYVQAWNKKSVEELMAYGQTLMDAIESSQATHNEALFQQYSRILDMLQKYTQQRLDKQGTTKMGKTHIGI